MENACATPNGQENYAIKLPVHLIVTKKELAEKTLLVSVMKVGLENSATQDTSSKDREK